MKHRGIWCDIIIQAYMCVRVHVVMYAYDISKQLTHFEVIVRVFDEFAQSRDPRPHAIAHAGRQRRIWGGWSAGVRRDFVPKHR